jgi:hypothetical protein
MVVVSERVGLGQGEVIREILSLEVAPGLRGVDDSPLVRRAAILQSCLEDLLGRNPVICTGTETLGLIESFGSSLGVQIEREEVFSFVGHAIEGPRCLVRRVRIPTCMHRLNESSEIYAVLTGTRQICQ